MQVETLDTTVRDYIDELKTSYEQRYHALETRNQELQNKVNEIETHHTQLRNDYLILKEQYDLLVYKRFVRSAEQLLADKKQSWLFTEEAKIAETAEVKPQEISEVKSFKRKKKGRKPIDPRLTREDTVIDIQESEKTCACGANLTRIGEEISEKLHITPPRIYVERIIRPKYACRNCEGTEDEEKPVVRIAPVEPSIIERSIASPSLLSTIIIQKYEDHLPYYRQEKQFERIGVSISRQDMSNWQQQVYAKLKPLFILLEAMVKSGLVLKMDETVVQVMGEEGREDTQHSYMWLALGGPEGKKVAWYEYHESRAAFHATAFLKGYRGYLQTDGYKGYDTAVNDTPGIIHVGCFAHARRKFYEAAKVSTEGVTAKEGMEYIKKLYVIEGKLRTRYEEREGDGEEEKNRKRNMFLRVRQMSTWRVLKKFKGWLIRQQEAVPPSLLLGKAIEYSLTQWDKLVNYLKSPYLTPDNNACENAIRPFVIGRNNWMFNKSPEGAKSSCGMYTLIQTAKQNGLISFNYLTALFERAPYASLPEDWEKLLPWNIFKS